MIHRDRPGQVITGPVVDEGTAVHGLTRTHRQKRAERTKATEVVVDFLTPSFDYAGVQSLLVSLVLAAVPVGLGLQLIVRGWEHLGLHGFGELALGTVIECLVVASVVACVRVMRRRRREAPPARHAR